MPLTSVDRPGPLVWMLSAAGAAVVITVALPGRALTAICTAAWSSPNVPPTGVAAAPLAGSSPPCPSSAVTASVTVGGGLNAGKINTADFIIGAGTNNFVRTSLTSVDLGVSGYVPEGMKVTFDRAVTNPYLFFAYLDGPSGSPSFPTNFIFAQPIQLLQANNATISGQTVTTAGSAGNTQDDGFVVQVIGTFSTLFPLKFIYENGNGGAQSVAFTVGVQGVPAPLPLMGAGVAFGFSRRLRRRIRAGS